MKKFVLITLLLTITLVLTACGNEDTLFELIGDDAINLTVDSDYTEMGFIARSDSNDITEYVTINNQVDVYIPGDYTVTYTLEYQNQTQTLERTVYVRDVGCGVIIGTNITQCDVNWSAYLHTYVKLRIYYEDDEFNGEIAEIFDHVEGILAEYNNLSDKYALYDGYTNVKTINDDPTTIHTIDSKLFDLIKFTIDHQAEVDNRFNLALGPVLKIWHDYRESCNIDLFGINCPIPEMADLQAADQYTDYTDIILNENDLTIQMAENMSIDLGGVSKGYISNIVVEYLDGLGLRGYLFNNGESNVSTGGLHPTRDNGEFLLAVTDPTFELPYYATVYIGDGDQLVTSGDYQQNFVSDGTIYHHIINPTTLMPDHNCRSVSIITSDAALADLYSTAIFTMTIEEGITFVDGIEDLEAIWYGYDNEIYFSENFEELYLVSINE